MVDKARKSPERWLLDRILNETPRVTEEDVNYFRDHPEQIDEVSAPTNLHRIYLVLCLLSGALLVAVSKALAHLGLLSFAHPALQEFVIDMAFEIGVALIGAAIVTFVLVIVLNKQQRMARVWRRELRQRIREKQGPEG